MNLDQLGSIVTRLCFLGAVLLACAAVSERIANFLGYTILLGYTPGRMFEFAVVLLVFVIAMLLRQVRDELRSNGGSGRP